jgi:transposase-like protein
MQMPIPAVPSFDTLAPVLRNEQACLCFLMEEGAVYLEFPCSCGEVLEYNAGRLSFRCTKRGCRKEYSVFTHSFFFKSSLPVSKVMHLAHIWLCRGIPTFAIAYTGHSSATITSYFSYFRQLVADSLDFVDMQIGGEDVIVELDESKFGKRKYHRGHRVEGVWVLGGVERTTERKIFLVQVPDRSAATLLPIIARHVLPGSIVHTDLWRSYFGVADLIGVSHLTVNHSQTFVDEDTGVHTNYIEGSWAGIKIRIPVRCRNQRFVQDHLFEFMWRRRHERDLWGGFLGALKDVKYM